jgi:hypothetical protein
MTRINHTDVGLWCYFFWVNVYKLLKIVLKLIFCHLIPILKINKIQKRHAVLGTPDKSKI